MQIRTFWKAREQTRKTMLIFAHQPQYSVIFVGRKLGRFGVPGFCVVCLLCLSTRPWGGPPRSGASQGLGIGNIMLVMQGKPNFQRITGATCAPPRPRPKKARACLSGTARRTPLPIGLAPRGAAQSRGMMGTTREQKT